MRCFAILSLITLCLAGCTPYRATHNLGYGTGANQIYDFYEPRWDTAGSPRPAILVIHGGGYISGDKSWADAVAEKFCPFGYVVVAINYTLATAPGGQWPVQLNDAKAALAYMRDPSSSWMRIKEPIAGFGVSAGAHLVGGLHLQGDLPLAIGASGPWDFLNVFCPQLDPPLRLLLGIAAGDPIPPGARAMISPVTWVKPDADMLLIHATGDTFIVPEHAKNMHLALQSVGAQSELIMIDSDEHGSAWKDAVVDMRRWLRSKQQ